MDYDGTIDVVSTDVGCRIKGVGIKLTERLETEEDNFCFAKGSVVRDFVRWAPEIGGVIGGVVGGFVGSGVFSVATIPGGFVVGSRVGAAVLTVYTIGERITGTRAKWPGRPG
jgi:hypothetical protein